MSDRPTPQVPSATAGFARLVRVAPCAALIAALILGFWNLGGWLMNDDEGAYLYDAWRVGLGEVPYLDFSLVQTPLAFGVVGGIFSLTGPSVWAARAVSYLFVLGAAVLLFMAGMRFLRLSRGAALAGAGIFLLNKHVFFLGRSFLPDNLMLLGGAAMLYAALEAESGGEGRGGAAGARGRAAFRAGLFAGLAALAKLNGIFLFAGYGIFLVVSMLGRDLRRAAWGKAWRAAAGFGLSFGLPYGLMLAFVPGTFKHTLGFHLAPGGGEAGYSAGLVAARFGKLVGNHDYALFALAFVGVWAAVRAGKSWRVGLSDRGAEGGARRAWLLAATAAAACLPIFLPGKYFLRYVLPAFLPLALLFAIGIEWLIGLARGGKQRSGIESQDGSSRLSGGWPGVGVRCSLLGIAAWAMAAVLILLCLGPTLSPAKIGARDEDTRALVRLVEESTRPGQYVFGDDPFVNFLAGRPCPPRLVDVSQAMVKSGWITSGIIERECEAAAVALVFVERGNSAHHLAALPDAAAFGDYLAREFRFWRSVKRQFLDVDIFLRKNK